MVHRGSQDLRRSPTGSRSLCAGALLSVLVALTVATKPRPTAVTQSVVIRTRPGATAAVSRMVRSEGASVSEALPLIDGFAARVSARTESRLRADPRVVAIDSDVTLSVQGMGSAPTRQSDYLRETGAIDAHEAGWNGSGQTVALVDTGVDQVPDLAGRLVPVVDDSTGKVAPCENLSGEADCTDNYGHGTFLAGIIAGTGASSGGQYQGVAPGARILSVKVAGRDGSADVSNVLAAIQWVVSFRDRYGIGILNLSLGTDSVESTRVDPLNYGVERAWQAGLTVVVAASNRGPAPGTISKPGDDPWVVTVGAVDDRGTPTVADDEVPLFSGRGPSAGDGWPKPDLVAPGAHLVSLTAPGSTIDRQFPSTLGNGYRLGSGTSMATAVVSGTVALMLYAHPGLLPNQVKFALMATARPAASASWFDVGACAVDAYTATVAPPAGSANANTPDSNGLGALDLSRGSVRVATTGPLPVVVSGLLTAQLVLWDPVGFLTGDWSASTWYVSVWNLSPWQAVQWWGSNWEGSNWEGSQWYGTFDGSSWYGSNWEGSAWYGAWG